MNNTAPNTVANSALPLLIVLVQARKQARWQWKESADEHAHKWVTVINRLDERIKAGEAAVTELLDLSGFRVKRGYNELVGLQATFSRVVPRYRLTHHYRWRVDGKQSTTGTLRGYDMHRYIPATEILHKLGDVYAPAVLSVWYKVTKASNEHYLQFEVGASPAELNLPGAWHIWAEL